MGQGGELLRVRNLRTHFPTPSGLVRAVNGVDLSIPAGSSVGIVGESGSGKSVLSLTVMGLVPTPPAIIHADEVTFEGADLLRASEKEKRRIRGKRLSMIFQDPMTSLNPFLTIGDQIGEPLVVHEGLSASKARARVMELLDQVGIPQPAQRVDAYPHEFSGGMRQRVMVAMAIACRPALVIADEPTTALDVTIQAQILELLQQIRRDYGTSIILITHDMGVAAGFCDEIYVMYAGRVVEHAATDQLFAQPAHPYTEALLSSVPRLDDEVGGRFRSIPGQPPDLTKLPAGCSFAPRCRYVEDGCRSAVPPLVAHEGAADHQKACIVDIRVEGAVR